MTILRRTVQAAPAHVLSRPASSPPTMSARLDRAAPPRDLWPVGAAAQATAPPHQPNAMSSQEVSIILAEAIARFTLGPRSLRHLKSRGWTGRPSGVAKVLRRHHLGIARQRVA